MKPEAANHIGRPIKQRVTTKTPAVTAQSSSSAFGAGGTARVENPANITITNVVGSSIAPLAPCSGAVEPSGGINIMGTNPDMERETGGPEHWGLGTSEFTPRSSADNVEITTAAEPLNPNPKLHRFRAKRSDELEVIVDVEALTHIIHVLIDNHSIIVTPKDLEDILRYWGDPTVKTELVAVQSRSVPVAGGGCCACTDEQKEEVIETIKSIALNGLNLVKSLPDLVSFFARLGLSI
jgi:hypothetical protein